MKPSIRWVAVAAALTLASQAQAAPVTFTNLNPTATVKFVTTFDGASLNATVVFTLTGLTASTATFTTSVTNNSSGPGQNSLLAFGVTTVTPTLTGASTNSADWSTGLNTTLPGYQKVNLCIYDSNNCAGGNINNGLGMNLSDSFTLTLTTAGNFMTNGVTFADGIGIKFQGAGTNRQSVEFSGCIVGQPGCTDGGGGGGGGAGGGGSVPEPDVLALIGIAALAAGLSRRALKIKRG